MTTETLEKAKKIDNEIHSLTLVSMLDANDIIPISVTYGFVYKDCDGMTRQCTTDISLSTEMRQIVKRVIEDRVKDLKEQLEAL